MREGLKTKFQSSSSKSAGSPCQVLTSADELSQQNFAETLPREMSVKIFSKLDIKSLCCASSTCKQWNHIIESDDLLWRKHCLTVLAVCQREVTGDKEDGLSWKVTLIRNYRKGRMKRNWLRGRFSNIRSAEELPANSMYQFDVETWGEILEAELERES
ncbi:F-box only protein 48 [Denticeps clupeoides]|uniref:F-box domain-containing protein n=1 Tax=Denticeps clupeoides TaxID=299321 RepID=A0AAY4AHJ4_9TELE|nr:F-box only protein 48 [Denticeps clupeoides]